MKDNEQMEISVGNMAEEHAPETQTLRRGLSAIALHNPTGVQIKVGQKTAKSQPEKRS